MIEHREFAPTGLVAARRMPVPPGRELRMAVEATLLELSTTDPSLHHADDLLLAGLAWSAATGDLCRIQPAARAARAARSHLAGDGDRARSALLTAREFLTGQVPNPRDAT